VAIKLVVEILISVELVSIRLDLTNFAPPPLALALLLVHLRNATRQGIMIFILTKKFFFHVL
jgi:hypothetical protein